MITKEAKGQVIHSELLKNMKHMLTKIENMSDSDKIQLAKLHEEKSSYVLKQEILFHDTGVAKFLLAFMPADEDWNPIANGFTKHKDINGSVLTCVPVPELRDLLTDKAKKVYDTKLTSIVNEIIECHTCKETYLKSYKKDHEKHKTDIKCKAVQYLGTVIEVPHMHLAEDSNYLKQEKNKRIKQLAHIINTGVENGWLKYGTLTQTITIPLATLCATEKHILLTYIASDFSREELNKLYSPGEKNPPELFIQEGQLPNSKSFDVWESKNK